MLCGHQHIAPGTSPQHIHSQGIQMTCMISPLKKYHGDRKDEQEKLDYWTKNNAPVTAA